MFKLSAFYHTTPPLLVGRTKRRVPKNVSRIEVDIGPGGIDPDGTKDETDVTLHLLDGGNDSFHLPLERRMALRCLWES